MGPKHFPKPRNKRALPHTNSRNVYERSRIFFHGCNFTVLKKRLLEGQYFFLYKSSQRRCSVRKGVLRNFAKFTGKQLCQRLFFNKVAGHRYYRTSPGDFFCPFSLKA